MAGEGFEPSTSRPSSCSSARFAVTLVFASGAAVLVWRGRRSGAPVALALLPLEAVFWYGFALPIPWLVGAARLALLVAAARALREPWCVT